MTIFLINPYPKYDKKDDADNYFTKSGSFFSKIVI
jgi:hypothetical protein